MYTPYQETIHAQFLSLLSTLFLINRLTKTYSFTTSTTQCSLHVHSRISHHSPSEVSAGVACTGILMESP